MKFSIRHSIASSIRRIRVEAIVSTVAVLFAAAAFATPVNCQDGDETERAIAIFNRGQDAHEKGDLTSAISLYKEALELIEEFPEAEYQLAVAYRQSGDRTLAERSFRRAIEFRDSWSLAYAGLGSLLLDKGEFEEARSVLAKAIELDEQNIPAIAAFAELLIRSNAPKEKLRSHLDVVSTFASKARPPVSIWIARGLLQTALGEKAEASFTRALELDPNNITALKELSLIALSRNDVVSASAYVRKIESLGPVDHDLRLLKAKILIAEGKTIEARRLLSEVPDPSSEITVLLSAIDAATATDVAELEKRLVVDPVDIAALSRLCVLYRRDNPSKALLYCRRASEAEPDNIDHAIGYGAALVQAKEYAGASDLLKKLKSFAPENATIRANLATALFESGRLTEAKDEYKWLTEKQPEKAVAFYFLAVVYDRLGEYLDAVANYQQFLKIADPAVNQLEIDKVNLRMTTIQKQIKDKKGK
ncbi:tetratricopeptide repeat protein [Leptolyngbya sp. 7M]|uniref:tetratricopeptide repeat protein n=1 Tax=Leptolyngbya sp. 7M TaxID=2812896 RepID=UPI001B8C33DC|nr:tetratricopeptide repeat protein [Leptolyngbya sp. 7M]QYO65927.1 tetratricopeptide repeat protein [Leptolyngbya sp. 7M]